MNDLRELDRVLRGEARGDAGIGPLVRVGLLLAAVSGVCVGVYGLFRPDGPEWRQLLASGLKVPALFFLTLLATFPSLYVFNTLLGPRLRFGELMRLVLSGLGVLVAVLSAFGPIVAFFSITTTSYPFILLLNVVVFAVSGAFGMGFLHRSLPRQGAPAVPPEAPRPLPAEGGGPEATPEGVAPASSGSDGPRPPQGAGRRAVSPLFYIWMVLFSVVGGQMAWVLRPFLGAPEVPFTWLRPRQSSFPPKRCFTPCGRCSGDDGMPGWWLRNVETVLQGEGEGRLREAVLAVAWGGALYGAVMGSYGGWSEGRAVQVIYSGLKVPLLLGVTTILTLPSFFVLNTLLGLRPDFPAVLRAVVGAQGAVALVLACLAPYTAVWYASTTDYRAALLFNGVMFALASASAQGVLRAGYAPLIARNPRHRVMLWAWLLVYCFVCIQMAWVLRPFVGQPQASPSFFREGAWGNAYAIVLEALWKAFAK